MSDQNTYSLILGTKVFNIPSKFPFLSNIKADVYSSLIQNGKYEVKSDVSENVFESFINHWIHQQIPVISKHNIQEYISLSSEFDRMKSIIQIYQRHKTNQTERNSNLKLSKQFILNEKDQKANENKQIITYICNNDLSKYIIFDPTRELNVMKYKLIGACESKNLKFIDSFTRKTVKFDEIDYVIYEDDQTAALFNVENEVFGDICIPRAIKHDGKSFVVTTILQKAFLHANVWNLEFANDSEVCLIDNEAFYNCGLRVIKIPKHLKKIGSKAFYFSNQFCQIIFPDDSELELIDQEAFSHTKLESIAIPSHLKEIGVAAFNCCGLKNIEFQENSELKTISEYAFMNCNLKSIKIPKSVKEIKSQAFHNCGNLETIEIPEDSELRTIGEQAFICTLIKSIFIPAKVTQLIDGWSHGTPNLVNVFVSPKNEKYSCFEDKFIVGKSDIESNIYDVLVSAKKDLTEITVPSFIKEIAPFAFSCCEKLVKINFTKDSEVESIGDYAFFLTKIESISIPNHVKCISKYAFAKCKELKLIEISEKSEIKIIDKSSFDKDKVKLSIPAQLADSIIFIEPETPKS